MQTKEQDVLQEFFDLNDLKAGIRNVRDGTKTIVRSIFMIVDSMLLPFRIFFTLSNSKAIKKLNSYYDRRQSMSREIENELRQLGAYDFNPDQILLNPLLALISMPVQTTRFIFDEAGVDEVPSWLKKAQDTIADEQRITTRTIEDKPGLLGQLSKLFFVTESVDPIEQLISEAASSAKADREALKIFKSIGIDVESMQNEFYENTISVSTGLLETLERRIEIFKKMSTVKSADGLLGILKLAKKLEPSLDIQAIENEIKQFEAGENDDPKAINQAISGIVDEGFDEIKNEVLEAIKKLPAIKALEDSSHPMAGEAISLIKQINSTIEKM